MLRLRGSAEAVGKFQRLGVSTPPGWRLLGSGGITVVGLVMVVCGSSAAAPPTGWATSK